jgi:hypothetical protein
MLGMIDLGMQVLKLLAVAGGAAVGWLGSGVLFRLLARMSLGRQVPRPMMFVVRALGAVALGLAVWYWAFGTGGSGFGTGAGLGCAGGQGPGAEVEAPPEPRPLESPPLPAEKAGAGSDVLRVEMLGGARVQEQRFYVLEGERRPKTFAELREALQARQQDKSKGPLKGVEIVIYEDSVAQDHPAVRDLERWAKQHDLAVRLVFPPRANR